MFSPATRRRDATRLPVALQGGLSVSPVCLWVRAGCARRRSGYRHWHIGWTFQYRFVCVGIRLRPVFSHEGRTAAEVRRRNLARMEKRRLSRQGFSSGKYMTTRHRMEHDIGRREARFVWHILLKRYARLMRSRPPALFSSESFVCGPRLNRLPGITSTPISGSPASCAACLPFGEDKKAAAALEGVESVYSFVSGSLPPGNAISMARWVLPSDRRISAIGRPAVGPPKDSLRPENASIKAAESCAADLMRCDLSVANAVALA